MLFQEILSYLIWLAAEVNTRLKTLDENQNMFKSGLPLEIQLLEGWGVGWLNELGRWI